jgi:hypothetical protein
MTDSPAFVVGDKAHKSGLAPSTISGLFFGMLLAVLTFSHVAATIGLSLNSFRPLGGAFFSMRGGQNKLIADLYQRRDRVAPHALLDGGRKALVHAPLSGRSLWLVGMGHDLAGRPAAAARAMNQAVRISRRDSAVQLWLGTQRLQRSEVAPALRHFDLMIRANRDAAGVIIPRMAQVIRSPEGRRFLRPYIRSNNGWAVDLLRNAVETLPTSAPIAALLIERKKPAPKIDGAAEVYARLVERLVEESSYREALTLFPLLPDARRETLTTVEGLIDGKVDAAYPPFAWKFPIGTAQGGAFVGTDAEVGLDLFADAGTVGVAATKLVTPVGKNRLTWTVDERTANLQSEAHWVATCLMGKGVGDRVQSVDLLSNRVPLDQKFSLALPDHCELVRLDLRMAGGIGQSGSNLIISRLSLISLATAR